MGVGEFFAKPLARQSMSSRTAIATSRQSGRKSVSRGFTLLEVLIVVTIAAIVLALGIPSFQNTIVSNRLTTTANAFVSTYNEARIRAIRRNSAVQFCGSTTTTNGTAVMGTACGSVAGATFMLDAGGTTATKVAESPAVPSGVTLTSAVAVRFNGQGFARAAAGGTAPYTGLLLDLSTNRLSVNNRRCVYLTTGSIISVCSTSGTGACDANEPANCQ